MRIITSGKRYIDIDAYASMVAYAKLLNLQEQDSALAVSTAVLNESITPKLRALQTKFDYDYMPTLDDKFTLVDISEPEHFDTLVSLDSVNEVIDHHPGLEQYWENRKDVTAQIDHIGAAATLIFERWQSAVMLRHMSNESAELLAAAILDNTLNFEAVITTDRDRIAFDLLQRHASLDVDWTAGYFTDCQQGIIDGLPQSIIDDTKQLKLTNVGDISFAQMVLWDASDILRKYRERIDLAIAQLKEPYLLNLISISEGRNYLMCTDALLQDHLSTLLSLTFKDDAATSDRLWLRKEILKADQSLNKN